jgi:hypothetical protein
VCEANKSIFHRVPPIRSVFTHPSRQQQLRRITVHSYIYIHSYCCIPLKTTQVNLDLRQVKKFLLITEQSSSLPCEELESIDKQAPP